MNKTNSSKIAIDKIIKAITKQGSENFMSYWNVQKTTIEVKNVQYLTSNHEILKSLTFKKC